MAARRWRANYRRKAYADIWPIDQMAGAPPPCWPGWPDGKEFALVLTHDTEGKKGRARVERLMNLEQRYGYRSCFNFVAKGDYDVSKELRNMLEQAGFEVGIHGLEHNEKLYASKVWFAAQAAEIRKCAQDWNASGFRTPLMLHRLSWLHQLGCEYDASTFDTDPFEPEPDGVRTIYPFWVPGMPDGGYVELPYTLVQDFTLFKVLREQDIEIWKRKIDWIAKRGGMALINTHPDYMCFEGKQARDEYPVSYYEEFLQYVECKYKGRYWAAQPRDVARYYCNQRPVAIRNTRKKIAMVAYSEYETDNRVRRYAEALARRGDLVDVIALNETCAVDPKKQISGITVYRIQKRDHNERNEWTYAWYLCRFLFKSSVLLTKLHARNRYDVIHVHNIPDFLVFGAWYPKLTGAKMILDIHDIVPELFADKFKTGMKAPYVKLLRLVEKMSGKFVDHVIVSNHLWRDTLVSRSVNEQKCSVVVNSVDSGVFSRRLRTRNDGRYVVIFPGSFQWHQGLETGIEAFGYFKRDVPNAEFQLYGGGNINVENKLKALVGKLGLEDSVKFCGNVSLDNIAEVIANADLGVVPKLADAFGNEAYSTKIMEFMSQGVPVVASRTKVDLYYFSENDVHFFKSGDSLAMARAMLDVARDNNLRESLVARGLEYVRCNGWDQKKNEYIALIDSLTFERFDDIEVPHGSASVVEH
jgi:glycosyltransferase involved in cell wall biosynthesis/peptidoglycan/xylan/chitin deacetylase (PgdA/CDA1 family)